MTGWLWLLGLGGLLAVAGVFAGRRGLRTWRELYGRRYPAFVRDDRGKAPLGVPVFTYHSIGPDYVPDSVTLDEFERQMAYLAANGYETLTADQLVDHLETGAAVSDRAVVITFDDGRASLWTHAFPVLRRYGVHAICFLVPGAMTGRGVRSTSGDDHVPHPDLSDRPFITWDEARELKSSGFIDFQSHTDDHTLVFCGPEIVDFVQPGFRFGFANFGVPAIRVGDDDHLHQRLPWGTPIYNYQPRMRAARRFFDDEGLRAACVEYVARHGGEGFFGQRDWRSQLNRLIDDYRQAHDLDERYETADEQRAAIRASLANSKHSIEQKLPGQNVTHLCYPWHRYSMLAASLAQELGYRSTFIDINPQKPVPVWNDPYRVQYALPINGPGDDPHQITRIDARDNVVLSLPGEGRLTWRQRWMRKLLRPPERLRRMVQP